MYNKALVFGALLGPTLGCIWDGSFNEYSSVKDFEKCDSKCGQSPSGGSGSTAASAAVNVKIDVSYQWFIKGSQSTEKYIDLSDKYKNPADTACKQGAKLTVDSTSKFQDQQMLRTELVAQQKPQLKQKPLNKGKVAHHFSFKHGSQNTPNAALEHQLCYFDSGLTELKYGGSDSKKLKWHVEGESQWEVELKEEEWHNCIYEIDYEKKEVSLWHSTEGEEMKKVSGPHKCNKCESNGKDWHVGVAINQSGGKSFEANQKEDWYVSGCYVEEGGEITKKPVSKLE